MEPQKGAIIDASALSYAVWGKVIGIDRSRFNSASITCREEVTFSPAEKARMFSCTVKWGDGTTKNVVLTEEEIRRLAHFFTPQDKARISKHVPREFTATFDVGALTRMRRALEKIKQTCSSKQCYTTPEIPFAFRDGRINDPVKWLRLYTKDTKEHKIFVPDKDRAFNKALKELIEQHNIKVLIDKDTDRWFTEVGIPNASEHLRNIISNALYHLGLKDRVVVDNVGGVYAPVIKIYDIDIKEERGTIKAEPVGYAEVNIEPKHIKYFDYKTKKEKTFGPRDIAKEPAVGEIYKVLTNKVVDIQEIHEALKRLRYAEKVPTPQGEKWQVKIFYPESAIIDTYLKTIKKENIEVITEDRDVLEPVGVSYE